MNINTNRLRLFEITFDDMELIHNLHCIPKVDEYNTLGIPANIEITRNVIKPMIEDQTKDVRSLYCWKINLKETNIFIGLAGMSLSNDRFRLGEIYYKLHPDFWGNGFATEVAKKLIATGFGKLKLHKIEAGVATGNKQSIKILEKIGMTREGLRRKILPIRGEWKDNFHYAIVEDDPRDY